MVFRGARLVDLAAVTLLEELVLRAVDLDLVFVAVVLFAVVDLFLDLAALFVELLPSNLLNKVLISLFCTL